MTEPGGLAARLVVAALSWSDVDATSGGQVAEVEVATVGGAVAAGVEAAGDVQRGVALDVRRTAVVVVEVAMDRGRSRSCCRRCCRRCRRSWCRRCSRSGHHQSPTDRLPWKWLAKFCSCVVPVRAADADVAVEVRRAGQGQASLRIAPGRIRRQLRPQRQRRAARQHDAAAELRQPLPRQPVRRTGPGVWTGYNVGAGFFDNPSETLTAWGSVHGRWRLQLQRRRIACIQGNSR